MAEEVHLPASVDASDISAFRLGVMIVVYAVHHCGARMPLLKSLQVGDGSSAPLQGASVS